MSATLLTIVLLLAPLARNIPMAVLAAILMIAPEIVSTIVGVALVVPVVLRQIAASRRAAAVVPAD